MSGLPRSMRDGSLRLPSVSVATIQKHHSPISFRAPRHEAFDGPAAYVRVGRVVSRRRPCDTVLDGVAHYRRQRVQGGPGVRSARRVHFVVVCVGIRAREPLEFHGAFCGKRGVREGRRGGDDIRAADRRTDRGRAFDASKRARVVTA